MPSHQLYALAFPEDALDSANPSAQRRQAQQGQLTTGPPAVRTIAAEPGERELSGDFRGKYADIMAEEVQELLQAGDIDAVPYFVRNETRGFEGYYEPRRQREADRRDPRIGGVHRFSGVLTFTGTNESHLRTVEVSNSTVTNPFGSASTQTVLLANSSIRPRWVSQKGDTVTDASVQNTFNGEKVAFDEFDATEPAFSTNESWTLVYDLPYPDEWQQDPRVWDDHDRNQSVTENNVTVDPAWAHVYDPGHSYNGSRVIETGRMRLLPDPSSNTFTAQQWNDTSAAYENVSLGSSDWVLSEWDTRRIGLERVTARTRWENSSDTTQTAELEAEVLRGQNETLFYEPENADGSAPSGLVTLLTPIAMDTDEALGEDAGLLERNEVPDE